MPLVSQLNQPGLLLLQRSGCCSPVSLAPASCQHAGMQSSQSTVQVQRLYTRSPGTQPRHTGTPARSPAHKYTGCCRVISITFPSSPSPRTVTTAARSAAAQRSPQHTNAAPTAAPTPHPHHPHLLRHQPCTHRQQALELAATTVHPKVKELYNMTMDQADAH